MKGETLYLAADTFVDGKAKVFKYALDQDRAAHLEKIHEVEVGGRCDCEGHRYRGSCSHYDAVSKGVDYGRVPLRTAMSCVARVVRAFGGLADLKLPNDPYHRLDNGDVTLAVLLAKRVLQPDAFPDDGLFHCVVMPEKLHVLIKVGREASDEFADVPF